MVGFGTDILLAFVFFPLMGGITTIVYLISIYHFGSNKLLHILTFILGISYLIILNTNGFISAYFTQQTIFTLFLFAISISPIFVGAVGIVMMLAGDA